MHYVNRRQRVQVEGTKSSNKCIISYTHATTIGHEDVRMRLKCGWLIKTEGEQLHILGDHEKFLNSETQV